MFYHALHWAVTIIPGQQQQQQQQSYRGSPNAWHQIVWNLLWYTSWLSHSLPVSVQTSFCNKFCFEFSCFDSLPVWQPESPQKQIWMTRNWCLYVWPKESLLKETEKVLCLCSYIPEVYQYNLILAGTWLRRSPLWLATLEKRNKTWTSWLHSSNLSLKNEAWIK